MPSTERRRVGGEDEVRVQVHRAFRRAGRAAVEPETNVVAQRCGGLAFDCLLQEFFQLGMRDPLVKPSREVLQIGSDTNTLSPGCP